MHRTAIASLLLSTLVACGSAADEGPSAGSTTGASATVSSGGTTSEPAGEGITAASSAESSGSTLTAMIFTPRS